MSKEQRLVGSGEGATSFARAPSLIAPHASLITGNAPTHGAVRARFAADVEPSCGSYQEDTMTPLPFIIIVATVIVLLTGFRIAQEYQRDVVFRLGR